MEERFKVKYQESGEILGYVYKLHNYDSSDQMTKFAVIMVGFLALVMTFRYGHVLEATPATIFKFYSKYLIYWIVIFFGALFVNRKIWRKMLKGSSEGQGFEAFEKRLQKWGEPLEVEMCFYDDHFENVTQIRSKSYSYDLVTKLVEVDGALGIIYIQDTSQIIPPKGVFGIPQSAVVDTDLEELKTFLLEKCTRMKHGVKHI